jgi:hypothetical protein
MWSGPWQSLLWMNIQLSGPSQGGGSMLTLEWCPCTRLHDVIMKKNMLSVL